MATVLRAPPPPRQIPADPDLWTEDDAKRVLEFDAKEQQYRLFREFAKAFWHLAEPRERCIWTKHLDVVCDEMQSAIEKAEARRAKFNAIMDAHGGDAERAAKDIAEAFRGADGEPIRVVFLVPPRHSKSTLMRLLAAWLWLRRAGAQFLFLTAVDTLIETNGVLLRDLLRSALYADLQRHLVATRRHKAGDPERGVPDGAAFALRADTFAKEKLQNTCEGTWEGHVLGGRFVGVNADVIGIDDPHDIDDAMNETASPMSKERAMLEVESTYKSKVEDRFNNPLWGVCFLIMQRVHPKDLANYMINQGATVVCLPGKYNPTHPHRYTKDWRTEPGELLCPARFSEAWHEWAKKKDPHGYATKVDLLPSAPEGISFKRAWFQQTYHEDPRVMARMMDEVAISADCANKTGPTNDYTSMGVWGRKGSRYVLLDRRYFRGELAELVAVFDELCAIWPMARFKYIENAANGVELIKKRRDKVVGIVPVPPRNDKASRAGHAKTAYASGCVWLPTNVLDTVLGDDGVYRVVGTRPNDWLPEYIENMVSFGIPGMHDDDVDMTSQVFAAWAQATRVWFTMEQRATMDHTKEGLSPSDGVWRWGRAETGRTYYVGIVPGWGTLASPAWAVVVDGRGKMVSLVETTDGGVSAFVAAVTTEMSHFRILGGRYAEQDGMPVADTVREFARSSLRLGASNPARFVGERGAGYRVGKADEAAILWGLVLRLAEQGRIEVHDGRTMAELDTMVDLDGEPMLADGSPVNGRALGLALALAAMRAQNPDGERVEEDSALLRWSRSQQANRPAKGDIWRLRG